MSEPLKIAIIFGSARENRFCDQVVRWLKQQFTGRKSIQLADIDPKDYLLADLPVARKDANLAALHQQLAEADGFIVVTPEYNHSFPAPLKWLIDNAYAEWQAKPVAFVSYGGISGGLRAVEQLRLVFAELHAVSLRDSMSFANPWQPFKETGGPANPQQAQRRIQTLITRLNWWGQALRQARQHHPYQNQEAVE